MAIDSRRPKLGSRLPPATGHRRAFFSAADGNRSPTAEARQPTAPGNRPPKIIAGFTAADGNRRPVAEARQPTATGNRPPTRALRGGRWQSIAGIRNPAADCPRKPAPENYSRFHGGRWQSIADSRSAAADCHRQPATENYSTIAPPRVRFPRPRAIHSRDPKLPKGSARAD